MKTSETQARQIHLSNTTIDSGGKIETSRGGISRPTLRFAASGFTARSFFRKACFTGFAPLAADLRGRVSLPAGRFVDAVFRVKEIPSFRFTRDSGRHAECFSQMLQNADVSFRDPATPVRRKYSVQSGKTPDWKTSNTSNSAADRDGRAARSGRPRVVKEGTSSLIILCAEALVLWGVTEHYAGQENYDEPQLTRSHCVPVQLEMERAFSQ